MKAKTLLGLACLVTGSAGMADQKKLTAPMTAMEIFEAGQVYQSTGYVPPEIEKLLLDTKERVKRGQVEAVGESSSPSRDCLATP